MRLEGCFFFHRITINQSLGFFPKVLKVTRDLKSQNTKTVALTSNSLIHFFKLNVEIADIVPGC